MKRERAVDAAPGTITTAADTSAPDTPATSEPKVSKTRRPWTDEQKQAQREKMLKSFADPEKRARLAAAWTPEKRAELSAKLKTKWAAAKELAAANG